MVALLMTYLHFPMAATRERVLFDVPCSPLQWSGSTFMWLIGTLRNPPTLQRCNKKIFWLVECDCWLIV